MSNQNLQLCGCSWSGGKDSCFALMQAIGEGYTPAVLLNVMNESGAISRSHGIPMDILTAQAKAAAIPIITVASSWNDYEKNFTGALKDIRNTFNINTMVFGDIDLLAHREWEEMVCRNAGLKAYLPLWQEDRKQLVLKMLDSGIETIIVSCNEFLGEEFLGKKLDHQLIQELEKLNIDVCGENGEFHTLVINCPLFEKRIAIEAGGATLHDKYWFCDLKLVS